MRGKKSADDLSLSGGAAALAIAQALPLPSSLLPRGRRAWAGWRGRLTAWGVKALLVLLVLLTMLVGLPRAEVLACACSEVAIGSGIVSSAMSVDDASGNLTLTQSDIALPGVVPVELTRIYRSDLQTFGMFGYGWTANLVNFAQIAGTSGLGGDLWVSFTGSVETFLGSQGYANAKRTMQMLLAMSPAELTVIERTSGAQWVFDADSGMLKKYVDGSGNAVSYVWKRVGMTYGAYGQLVYCPLSVTYPDGRQLTFEYDTTGDAQYLCRKATSPSGFTVSYSYTDNLLTGISKSNGQYLHYAYHEVLLGTITGLGWLEKITYANAAEIGIKYNGQYGSTDAASPLRVTEVTGPLGYDHLYSYQTTTSPKDGSQGLTTTLTDALTHATSYAYSQGQTRETITDALGQATELVKNAQAVAVSVRDPRGKTTAYGYDDRNVDPLAQRNLLATTDPRLKTWRRAYDADRNLSRATDPLGHHRDFTYDAQHHHQLLTARNGLAQPVLDNTYTAQGQLETIKDGAGHGSSFLYDPHGWLTRTTDALLQEWAHTYDGAGNLLTSQDPYGHGLSLTYNGFYKVATATDALGHTTTFGYDEMANLTSVQDANGHTTGYGYDALQRKTSVTDALNRTTTFSFDAETNLTTLTDARTNVYRYTFDAADQTKTFVYPDASHESYGYDEDGNLLSLTNRAGKVIQYAYDDADRLSSKTYFAAVGANTLFSYAYDDANRLTGVTRQSVAGPGGAGTGGGSRPPTMTPQASVSYAYDDADRLTGVTADGRTVGYGYDLGQNVNQVTYPGGMVANYHYDFRHGLSTIKDAALNQIAGYSLDDAGKLTLRTLANGLETKYDYDAADRVTGITLRRSATPTSVVQSFGYGYDGVGNRTWVQYQNGTGDVYKYDETNEVTGVKYGVSNPTPGYDLATGATRTVTYGYDEVGNRTSVTDSAGRGAGATTAYTSNSLNQYTAVGSTSLTYTPRGDLLSDGTWTYGYDYEGHLISAVKSGTSVAYKYDANGRRIEKDISGVAVARYVYNGENLIEERDGAGTTVTAAYVYEGGIDHPVAVVKASGTYFFAQDALGNVVALTDASGTLAEQYTYDVYGKLTIKYGSGNLKTTAMTPFLFTGREYDQETGLYHYRSRAYSPTLGRFLQPDSIDFDGGDVNIYRYCGNNPVNLLDPLGFIGSFDDDSPAGDHGFSSIIPEYRVPSAIAIAASPVILALSPEEIVAAATAAAKKLKFDGPGPAKGRGASRICQVRYDKTPLIRLDYDGKGLHANIGPGSSNLHVPIWPPGKPYFGGK